eukprot:CAMPEP_0118950982 /NCGR_PEP_ID=MMETSP1169-20130426/52318_1 /TAXON_ID=36882 /ORGANISM="Pyramimonas obovata, Strain CCMP722" /LENGTH=144 /DNA_ID=CAMNT_0006897937 /DNA_START=39 /DNA_END=474 /DNA_ORIENTATION=-
MWVLPWSMPWRMVMPGPKTNFHSQNTVLPLNPDAPLISPMMCNVVPALRSVLRSGLRSGLAESVGTSPAKPDLFTVSKAAGRLAELCETISPSERYYFAETALVGCSSLKPSLHPTESECAGALASFQARCHHPLHSPGWALVE